jgi:hypothetical protein
VRRLLPLALLAAVIASACSGGGGSTSLTTLPPTTQAPTPILPTGVADAARRWVAALTEGADDDAFGAIAPRSQAAMGGRAGFPGAKRTLDREWGVWGRTTGAVFDGLPLSEGLAVVVLHVTNADGQLARVAALPMRVVDGRWRAEPLLSTGTYRATPADRSEVGAVPTFHTTVEAGVRVLAFVDGQPARVGDGTTRVAYRPTTALGPGWHRVTLVFQRGDDITARALRYLVPD